MKFLPIPADLRVSGESIVRRTRALGFRVALAIALSSALPVAGQAQQRENLVELYKKTTELIAVGKYVEAIPYARRALEIEESRSGPIHPTVAILLNDLAVLYHLQGRYADAEPLFKRSLAIEEKVLRPNALARPVISPIAKIVGDPPRSIAGNARRRSHEVELTFN